MIIVKLWGGIGNQLFQFVFGQYLKYRHNIEVQYDINSYCSVDKLRKPELDALDVTIKYDNSCLFSRYRGVKERVLRWAYQLIPQHHFINEGRVLPETFEKGHTYFMYGYWQKGDYYKWLKENVADFGIRLKEMPVELLTIAKTIEASKESVSIHVRRGDYFQPRFEKIYGVCDKNYFEKALSVVNERKGNVRVFLFSDDLEWVKNNIDLPADTVYVPNYTISQLAYILLMSMCKHHIISNSSFSWWGAVLSEQNGIVIAPSRWTLTSDSTIALNEWIKI